MITPHCRYERADFEIYHMSYDHESLNSAPLVFDARIARVELPASFEQLKLARKGRRISPGGVQVGHRAMPKANSDNGDLAQRVLEAGSPPGKCAWETPPPSA